MESRGRVKANAHSTSRQLRSARARRIGAFLALAFIGAVAADALVLLAPLVLLGMVAVLPVLVLVELSMAALALSTADGEVRTTVPVSLRGTAFCVASAAFCGVTPTVLGVEDPGMAGAGVCAKAPPAPSASAAAKVISFE